MYYSSDFSVIKNKYCKLVSFPKLLWINYNSISYLKILETIKYKISIFLPKSFVLTYSCGHPGNETTFNNRKCENIIKKHMYWTSVVVQWIESVNTRGPWVWSLVQKVYVLWATEPMRRYWNLYELASATSHLREARAPQ